MVPLFSYLTFMVIKRLLQPSHHLYTRGKELEESRISGVM